MGYCQGHVPNKVVWYHEIVDTTITPKVYDYSENTPHPFLQEI